MEVKKFRHRNNDYEVSAVKVEKGMQNDIAKWCSGTAEGRQSKRVVILNKKDGCKRAEIDQWVVKVGESFVVLSDYPMSIIFVTPEKWEIIKRETERLSKK